MYMYMYILHVFTAVVESVTHFLAAHQTLLDGLKVALAGVFFEAFRRGSNLGVGAIGRCLYLTARFNAADESYDWLYDYICEHAVQDRITENQNRFSIFSTLLEGMHPTGRTPPRDVQVTSRRTFNHDFKYYYERQKPEEVDEMKQGGLKLNFAPSQDTVQVVRFNGRNYRFKLSQSSSDWGVRRECISVSVFLGTHSHIQELVTQARREYISRDTGKLSIYLPDNARGGRYRWRKTTSKPLRPWESVILPPQVKDNLLGDAREFLDEKEFYTQRCIPYRRGYLLYGTPGSGKSSLISAMASRLKLDVYIVNLGMKGLDDSGLSTLLSECPARSILLMEDIDCAFKTRQSTTISGDEDEDEGEKNAETGDKVKTPSKKKDDPSTSNITLSGLLNALDGVASSEGRLLFCTTNHVEKIDPALSRPGRCDVWIEFGHATRSQAYHLFLHLYASHEVAGHEYDYDYDINLGANLSDNATPSPNRMDDTIFSEVPDSNLSSESKPETDGNIGNKANNPHLNTSPTATSNMENLARRFAESIPLDKVSVSALTAYLMRFKRKPEEAISELAGWVDTGYPQNPSARYTARSLTLTVGKALSENSP